MITREDIHELARLYDCVSVVVDPQAGTETLAVSPELDAFYAKKDSITETYLVGLANHSAYQDFTLNQLRTVAATVVSNMLSMVPQGAKKAPKKRSRK